MKPARIVIADDHPLIRAAIGQLVHGAPDFELVGEAADGRECVARVQELQPDILVLDIAMPALNGEQVAAKLHHLCPELKIVALSGYTEPQFVQALIKAGARAYVVKSASGRELIQALRAVANGGSYLSPEVTGQVMKLWEGEGPSAGPSTAGVLGRREKEVLRLIADGRRSAEIAAQLHIAVATVEAHRRNILRKLRLHSAAELTRYAVRHGVATL